MKETWTFRRQLAAPPGGAHLSPRAHTFTPNSSQLLMACPVPAARGPCSPETLGGEGGFRHLERRVQERPQTPRWGDQCQGAGRVSPDPQAGASMPGSSKGTLSLKRGAGVVVSEDGQGVGTLCPRSGDRMPYPWLGEGTPCPSMGRGRRVHGQGGDSVSMVRDDAVSEDTRTRTRCPCLGEGIPFPWLGVGTPCPRTREGMLCPRMGEGRNTPSADTGEDTTSKDQQWKCTGLQGPGGPGVWWAGSTERSLQDPVLKLAAPGPAQGSTAPPSPPSPPHSGQSQYGAPPPGHHLKEGHHGDELASLVPVPPACGPPTPSESNPTDIPDPRGSFLHLQPESRM